MRYCNITGAYDMLLNITGAPEYKLYIMKQA